MLYLMEQDVVLAEVTVHQAAVLVQLADDQDHLCVGHPKPVGRQVCILQTESISHKSVM